MDMADDCAPWGAIRFELGATVSTMMTGILAKPECQVVRNSSQPVGGFSRKVVIYV
jgi:hypothetical protein